MVRRLLSSDLVSGVHFCTLNLEKSVRQILDNLAWTDTKEPNTLKSSPLPRHNQLIEDDTLQPNGAVTINGKSNTAEGDVPTSMAGLSISPKQASELASWSLENGAMPPGPKKSVGGSGPQGPSGEDSWDEYPNGRFTDVRSPAYGEIDGWGSGLKITVSIAPVSLALPADAPRRPHKRYVTGEHPHHHQICHLCSPDTSNPTLPLLPRHFVIFPCPPNPLPSCPT
jgi:methylenetetrahydrofolate reductase (NADPH)